MPCGAVEGVSPRNGVIQNSVEHEMVMSVAAPDHDLRDDERRLGERAAAMLANDRRRLLPFAILAPVGPAVRGLALDRVLDAVDQGLQVFGDAERPVDQFQRRLDGDRLRLAALRIDPADQTLAVDLEGEMIVVAGDEEFMFRRAFAQRQDDFGIVHGSNRREPPVMAKRRQRADLPHSAAHSFWAARYSLRSRSRLALE